MKATLNDLFKSTARVIHLCHFRKGRLIWKEGEAVDEYEYRFSHLEGSGYFPKVPVILQSNGLPWDTGNAYPAQARIRPVNDGIPQCSKTQF